MKKLSLIVFFVFLALSYIYSQRIDIRRGGADAAYLVGNQDYNAQDLANTRNKTTTNGPILIMPMGDSLMNSDIWPRLHMYFMTNYGYAGTVSAAQTYLNPGTFGGGILTNDFANWYEPSYFLPSSGSSGVIFSNLNTVWIEGNVIEVRALKYNGAATISIETNHLGGAYAMLLASTNLDNGGAIQGICMRFTNAASATAKMTVRITRLSGGNANILNGGIINYSTKGGLIYSDYSVGGLNFILTSATIPTNVSWPILGAQHPDMILYKATDTIADLAANIGSFETMVNTVLTNTDVVIIGIQPTESDSDPIVGGLQQNAILRAACVRNGWMYIDGYSEFKSFQAGLSKGFLQTGGNPHLTAQGSVVQSDMIAKKLGLFAGTKNYITTPAAMAYKGGNLDLGGQFDGLEFPEGGLIIRGAPLSRTSGLITFIHGTGAQTNFQIYVNGTGKVVFRDNSGGFDLMEIRDDAGVVNVVPGEGQFGAVFNLGNLKGTISGKNDEPWWNIVSSNFWVYGPTGTVVQIIGTNYYPANFTVFQMTADGSNTNITTTTNTLWGAGSGSRRLDANWFQVGRELTAEMEGNWFDAATPGQVRLMAMFNTSSATNIAAQVLFTPAANITAGDNFRIKTKSVCRTIGASGTISTSGCIEIDNAGTPTIRYFTNQVLTVDTTAQLTFDLASTNGASTDSFLARNGTLMLH